MLTSLTALPYHPYMSNTNAVRKDASASRSYGIGCNFHQPARYVVVNAAGAMIGVIQGTRAGFREKSQWTVEWMSPTGIPRTVHFADSFADAKAWAIAWDGQAPEQWRVKVEEVQS